MTKKPDKEFIIISESVLQSWMKDLGSFALFTSLIGLGWLVDSTTLQVIGAIVGMIIIIARSNSTTNAVRVTSIGAAYERLDMLTGGRPSENGTPAND